MVQELSLAPLTTLNGVISSCTIISVSNDCAKSIVANLAEPIDVVR